MNTIAAIDNCITWISMPKEHAQSNKDHGQIRNDLFSIKFTLVLIWRGRFEVIIIMSTILKIYYERKKEPE